MKKISETKITHGVSIEADWCDVTALEWRAVVHLCCADGHPKKIPIARLVWEAFIGIEAIKICHIGSWL